ncbi:hypothetical protein Pla163_08540 [Planctomycetes bacterium Pla163]|uniref:Uncharacterized protein n=1 Tax=Rohdeia mirabilis TaxID=2528008 RepID=A0A518CWZ9_9BACT|nr:hypothetical protein Pla163_08540 [Planctomycetes bacterium Pla163]
MQWSKIKSRYEALSAPCFGGTLAVHVTSYSKALFDIGAGWITYDGVEVVRLMTPSFYSLNYNLRPETLDFGSAVHACVFEPVETLVTTADPVVRGLFLLDRRCGRRTYERIWCEELHPFTRDSARFRSEVEGWAGGAE